MGKEQIVPSTTRQFIELALSRIVDNQLQQPGSTWQYVLRFFRGELKKARVVFKCSPPKIEFMDESSNPAMYSVTATILVSSNIHDKENCDENGLNSEHDQLVADLIGVIFDADALRTALNTAMADDYGQVFNVVLCQPQGDMKSTVEGTRQTNEINVTILLQPPEIALALGNENPVAG